jgi:plastocyanin
MERSAMRTKTMGRLAATAAAGLVAAACGGGSGDEPAATPTAKPQRETASQPGTGSGTLKVAADAGGALKFTKDALETKAGKVTIDFSNPASIPHAVAVRGNGVKASTKVVTDGSSSVTVQLKPGTYTFFCPVDSHEQGGMKGTLTVSG